MRTGKILIIGPSRAGKSYYAAALKATGLPAVDTEKETALLTWQNNATGKVVVKPIGADSAWLANHDYLIDQQAVDRFLATQAMVIMFAHASNIMNIVGKFDTVVYMDLPSSELERRFLIRRPDHPNPGNPAEFNYFRQCHQERKKQALQRGIPLIDATLTPAKFYTELLRIVSSSYPLK